MLLNLIRAAQDGDQNDMLLLIQKFSPILKKYGKMLKYEDAINDLTLYFIELIHQFDAEKMSSTCDGAIIKYIAKCIYHFYLKLRKKHILITILFYLMIYPKRRSGDFPSYPSMMMYLLNG